MAEFTLFKSSIASCKYFFKNGNCAYFINGRFATDNESEIEELTAEIKAKHPTFYIDDKETVTDQVIQDPVSALRAKIRAEIEAEIMRDKDMGNTDKSAGEGAGMSTSRDLGELTAKIVKK